MTKIQFAIKDIINKNTCEIKEINLIQKEIINPIDNLTYKFNKSKERLIKNASSENPKATLFKIGQYVYIEPETKKKKYYTQSIPGVTGKKRHDNDSIIKVITPAIRNQMPYREAALQGRNLLNLNCVPSTIHKWINAIEIDEKSFNEIQQKVVKNFSGHVSIDEVHDREGTIISTDPVNDTILHITTHKDEITNETIESHLNDLKGMGIIPKTVSKDGSQLYVNTIQKVFSVVQLQLCIFHLLMNISKEFFKWMKKIRDKIKIPKLKRGRKKSGNDTGKRGNHQKNLKQDLFRARYLFLRKKLTKEELEKVRGFYQLFPELKELKYCNLLLRKIFTSHTLNEAEKRYDRFVNNEIVKKNLPKVIKKLNTAYERQELFTYLNFNRAIQIKIRTTNHTERTNRKFRKKQKTHYRIRKYEYKIKMLRFMQYYYNWYSINNKLEGITVPIDIFLIFFFGDMEFLSFF